jgi:succinyl-CoA synthetase alpha subunit
MCVSGVVLTAKTGATNTTERKEANKRTEANAPPVFSWVCGIVNSPLVIIGHQNTLLMSKLT